MSRPLLLLPATLALLASACSSYAGTYLRVDPNLAPGPEALVKVYRARYVWIPGFPFSGWTSISRGRWFSVRLSDGRVTSIPVPEVASHRGKLVSVWQGESASETRESSAGPPAAADPADGAVDLDGSSVVHFADGTEVFSPVHSLGHGFSVWRLSLPDRVWTRGPPMPDPDPYTEVVELLAMDRDRVAVVLERREYEVDRWIVTRRMVPTDTWVLDFTADEWHLAANGHYVPIDRQGTLAQHESRERDGVFEFRVIREGKRVVFRVPAVGDSTFARIWPLPAGALFLVELRDGRDIVEVAVCTRFGPIAVLLEGTSRKDRKRLIGK